jgi:hypothetical protein
MLTKDDTTADELGVTDADVAQWDAEIENYLSNRKVNPQSVRTWEAVKKRLRDKAERYREELQRKV